LTHTCTHTHAHTHTHSHTHTCTMHTCITCACTHTHAQVLTWIMSRTARAELNGHVMSRTGAVFRWSNRYLHIIGVCCSVLLHIIGGCCSAMQCVAVCCSVLQCVAVWVDMDHVTNRSSGSWRDPYPHTLQHTATHCNTLHQIPVLRDESRTHMCRTHQPYGICHDTGRCCF